MTEKQETPTVARDAAEAEFTKFTTMMALDVDPEGWDDEDKKSFQEAKRKIVGAIMAGRLAIDDEGQPVFTTSDGKKITFYEPTGNHLKAQDLRKEGHLIAKAFAVAAAMTKQDEAFFGNMKGRDQKVCQAIVQLFLA